MEAQLADKIQQWFRWDQNPHTREEIQTLVNRNDVKTLDKLLMSRLTFGTAGLRGVMGAGYSQMNDLVIIQTTQGLIRYLESVTVGLKEMGVVVGFDGRHNSERFAKLVAGVITDRGVHVFLYGEMVPTPFIPYAVMKYKTAAGIMITASHNPKEDNGYKVYWTNSAQIIPPHDTGIQISIEKNLEPWPHVWNAKRIDNNPLCTDPWKEVCTSYMKMLAENTLYRDINSSTSLRFTFTPMHGVSYKYMVDAVKACGFPPLIPVKEQIEPDPEFPTVKFPNPEEGKSALDLAITTANENNSTIILANDPDADRLAIAEKQPSGDWKVMTGNEIGALLGWWLWHLYKHQNPHSPARDVYMISSTVTSKILQAIAKKEGFNFVETLTGFKWMGNQAHAFLKEGKTVLFAFEEAIGFMCGTTVLDKDGISAAVKAAELAAYLHYTNGRTLTQQLQVIYDEYGYHVCNNSYYICYDQPTITSLFDRLRNFTGPNTYPISCGRVAVTHVRDLTTGYDSTQPDKRAILPVSKSTQMITFYFENGCVATLRTSGTEPKIKYYTELVAKPGQTDWQFLNKELDELVTTMIEEFMQPTQNHLIPRCD